MKLADDITITLAGEDIVLHPALRHAIRLERREGSFGQIVREINEGSLTAAVEIIRDHYDHPMLDHRVFGALPALKAPLLAYVLACAGIDAEEKSEGKANSKSKPVPFSEHLVGLYRIGTGWLGWTPDDTLDATPAEIMEAYKGRTDMLKAIFGGKDAQTKDDRGGPAFRTMLRLF